MDNKNQAVIDYLSTNPFIANNPLYFNFGVMEENASQMSPSENPRSTDVRYIDGSVLKTYTFTFDVCKSVASNAIISGRSDENIDDIQDVQNILDWINDQDDLQNYPNFGSHCIVEKIQTTSHRPKLIDVDSSLNPPMAIYRIGVDIVYLDTSKVIWS